jgi:hypothetical protein
MSKFVMPAEGTAEFDSLKARWESKPITFGQCGRLKTLFKAVADQGGYATKVNAKFAARMDYISARNDEGRWVNLRTDNADLNMTMWNAHMLGKTLESLINGDLEVTKGEPVKAEPAKRDAILEVASKVNFSDGDYVTVNGEAFRVSTTGKRAYLARV